MAIEHLTLIVLRCAFYAQLGLTFVEEQHGEGPVHHAAHCGGMVLELYPGKPGSAPHRLQSGATTLGFTVTSLEVMLAALRERSTIITAPHTTDWGLRAVVLDPDGRMLDLTEPVSG